MFLFPCKIAQLAAFLFQANLNGVNTQNQAFNSSKHFRIQHSKVMLKRPSYYLLLTSGFLETKNIVTSSLQIGFAFCKICHMNAILFYANYGVITQNQVW